MTYIILLYGYVMFVLLLGVLSIRYVVNYPYKFCCLLSVVSFGLLAAFRPDFFRDTATYIQQYKDVDWSYMDGINLLAKESKLRVEYGYIFLMNIFKSIGLPYQFFFMSVSVFGILVMFNWIKEFGSYISLNQIKNGYFFCIFTVILFHFGIFYSMVAIRSFLSLSLLMLTAINVKNRKNILAVICFLCAFSVQRMSLLGLLPIIIILLKNKIIIKKEWFVFIWIILGAVLFTQYRTNSLMNTLGIQLQTIYNTIMKTEITLGFDKISNQSITKAIIYFGYWINGIIYIFQYKENRNYSKFVIIYIFGLLLGAIVCGYPPSYRIVDYIYIYSLPVNYIALSEINKNYWKSKVCILMVFGAFYLVWFKSFVEWYRFG